MEPPGADPPEQGAASGGWAQAARLAKAFLDRLAPYGPAPVLVLAYFILIASLAGLSGKEVISESVTCWLGALGFGGLVVYLRHAERMSFAAMAREKGKAGKRVDAGKEMRKARRARLPGQEPPQLPLDLDGDRVEQSGSGEQR